MSFRPITILPHCHLAHRPFRPIVNSPNCQFAQHQFAQSQSAKFPFRPIVNSPFHHFAQLSTRPITISPNCQLAQLPFRPIFNSPSFHFAQLSTRPFANSPNTNLPRVNPPNFPNPNPSDLWTVRLMGSHRWCHIMINYIHIIEFEKFILTNSKINSQNKNLWSLEASFFMQNGKGSDGQNREREK